MATSRNRVIYQSEALFVSPTATGGHYTGATRVIENKPTDVLYAGGSCLRQIKRVQSANYSFTVNRQDVNEYGKLSRIDSVVVDTPTVNMDFSYYITDGENERLLGFVIDGQTSTMSGHFDPTVGAGQNYFILTVPEGQDAIAGDISALAADKSVIALGNGYITDYSVEMAVGGMPTASISVEGFNILSSTGYSNIDIPAIDPRNGSKCCDKSFTIPAATTGAGVSCLRPGDITLDLQNAALMSKQVSGDAMSPLPGSAHVQSVSINIPMSRTILQRLGNTFGFSRELDVPLTATMTVNALVADLKTNGEMNTDTDLLSLLCGEHKKDLKVTLHDPTCLQCDYNRPSGMIFELKGALLESESYSSSIGDNKTVDLTFSTQIGGVTDTTLGMFISGSNKSEDNFGRPPQVIGDTLTYWQPIDEKYPNG
tara:strand:+ start:18267 stop:19547 length:1281 start_codon:yes stop_codon:yes gene_type:complete